MKIKKTITKISYIAIMSALIYVCTAFIAVPYAGGAGYFNFSDGLILFATYFFGPLVGFTSGLIGCAFADLSAGYANCIPFTLLAKGLESIVFIILITLMKKTKYVKYSAFFIAPLFMVLGYIPYYLINANGEYLASLVSSGFDVIQGLVGSVMGLSLVQLMNKVNLPYKFNLDKFNLKKEKKVTE